MVTLLAGVGVKGWGAATGGGGTGQKFNLPNTYPNLTSLGLNERYWSTKKDAEIRFKKY